MLSDTQRLRHKLQNKPGGQLGYHPGSLSETRAKTEMLFHFTYAY